MFSLTNYSLCSRTLCILFISFLIIASSSFYFFSWFLTDESSEDGRYVISVRCNAGKTDSRSLLLRAFSCGCGLGQDYSFTRGPSPSIPHGWSSCLLSVTGTRQQGPLTRVQTSTKIAYHRMHFSKENEIHIQSPTKGQDWGARVEPLNSNPYLSANRRCWSANLFRDVTKTKKDGVLDDMTLARSTWMAKVGGRTGSIELVLRVHLHCC